CMQGLDFQWTF
nr:immunoglobulin light chain junction region [Macaca mulatta]MOV61061.1 immunoglobulin light chain junction region [Macaca mulatta]MOV61235.1 immunoglobulin light chain junction region [Macaca mulatta]MOV61294.1 immunoglobulin light chain junction region [Macaca mulatta]MOV61349.1 immunoglobulin light chain junction region [Macaca mulatta]